MTIERFERLLQQYLLQQMTEEELKEFLDAAVLPEFEPVLKAALDRDLQSTTIAGSSAEGQAEQSFESFRQLMTGHDTGPAPKYRRMQTGFAWLRYAAILILVAGTVIWMLTKKAPDQNDQQPLAQEITPVDIAPGGNRAQLTLSDGSVILLDSAVDGMLAQQGNAKIVKLNNGQLVYAQKDEKTGNPLTNDPVRTDHPGGHSPSFNTLTTPRGGQYKLTLPDGSNVWLNAASSITYPTAFTAKERVVTITGEAYFEVAKNAARPFIVKKGTTSVTVLGTHFNVNAYEDEANLKVTLLEGSVKVSSEAGNRKWENKAEHSAILKPGQQAVVKPHSPLAINYSPDIDKVMAWKNGIFNFHRASLQEVMRQLSRWYNVDVIYEKGIPAMEFGGEMGRDLTLAQVLKGFEDMEIHFRIEAGNRLIVMP
ncbi:FecR family protein [Longitalea luteola]|uniref:FecR family protein n=1 Tax=Longitalea luteola TaxID=2812563 RepID=UPI001A96D1DF|nr:FecR family protein [Longitalea luteola]